MENQTIWEMIIIAFSKMKPYLAMISLQFGYAGMHITTMLAFKRGFSHWILVVYRHAVAIAVITPFAFFIERKIRPKLTLSVFLKIVLLGFLEPVLDQNLYYLGLKYTSATFTAVTVNILPAVTFIMAVIFRLEKVYLKQIHSLAKVIGTGITLLGAMLMTFYKGPVVDILPHAVGGIHHNTARTGGTTDQHWITGTILLLSAIVGWSGFFIVQNKTLKEYPAPLSLTSLVCVMGMVESGVVAVIMEHHIGAWAVGFDSRLLAAVYAGIVCSGIAYYLQGVVNKARGPVFVTAFSPLSTIITAILGAMVLAEHIHLGSLIGAIIIVFGLYTVVWGKSKETSSSNKLMYEEDKPHVHDELPVVCNKTSDIVDNDKTNTVVIATK